MNNFKNPSKSKQKVTKWIRPFFRMHIYCKRQFTLEIKGQSQTESVHYVYKIVYVVEYVPYNWNITYYELYSKTFCDKVL